MKTHFENRRLALLLPLCALALAACAQQPMSSASNPVAAKELKAFPAAMAGHRRYVIELPQLPDENDHKLELIAGKAMQVDCNSRGMDGRFETRDVQGWGYSYWVFSSQGRVLSTMMMCPPDSARPGFVQAEPLLVRYNSKLPVVVFVPEDFELRWRIWQAGAVQGAMPR